MTRVNRTLVGVALSALIVGCGGGEVKQTEAEKDPNFGKNAMDQMKSMGITPKAAKGGPQESALEKMKHMQK